MLKHTRTNTTLTEPAFEDTAWMCNYIIKNSYVIIDQCLDITYYLLDDDVIKWKQFPRNWPFLRGIHRSPVKYPHKGQWRGALMFSLICAWINAWVNNREAGDLRRYRSHYDVTIMCERHAECLMCMGFMEEIALLHWNISHLRWNLQSFAFFITGSVLVRIFGGPLDLWLQDVWSHYRVQLPQTTSNILGNVILRLGLNSCDAGTICLQFGKKMCPCLTMLCNVHVAYKWAPLHQL